MEIKRTGEGAGERRRRKRGREGDMGRNLSHDELPLDLDIYHYASLFLTYKLGIIAASS